jgi:hypothetical protein
MSETSLYPAVKRFLEAASFDVKGEVEGCDIVAVRVAEGLALAIVEMNRMRAADELWLAVPATRRGRDRDPRVHRRPPTGPSFASSWPSSRLATCYHPGG